MCASWRTGEIFRVNRFLDSNPQDLLCMTKDGMSIAAIAAKYGQAKALFQIARKMFYADISFDKQYQGKHLFLAAIESRDIETVDAVCFNIKSSNIPMDDEKRTPVHYAAIWGDVELLDLFRRREGDIFRKDIHDKTPIHYAFEYNWEDLIKYLIAPDREIELPKNLLLSVPKDLSLSTLKKIIPMMDLNVQHPISQKTPLIIAVEQDNFELFHLLLEHGADCAIKDAEGMSPFLRAAQLDRIPFLTELYEKSKLDTTKEGKNALHIASELGHERAVSFLLSQGIDIHNQTPEGKTALHLAKEKELKNITFLLNGKSKELRALKQTLVALLKEEKINEFLRMAPSLSLNTSMVFEIEGSEICLPLLHLIHLLITSSDLQEGVRTAFLKLPGAKRNVLSPEKLSLDHFLAIKSEELDLQNIDVIQKDAEGNCVLHYYARSSTYSSQTFLTQALTKVDFVDIENNEGETPLFSAIMSKDENKVESLLKRKANPNHLTKKRLSPLLLAIEKELEIIVRLLVQYGANVNQQCLDTKITAIHAAVKTDNFCLVQFLVESGACITKKMARGILPIHIAAQKGNVNMLHFLRKLAPSGVDPDDNGWSLAHYAAMSQNPLMVEYLHFLSVPLDQKAIRKKYLVRTSPPTGITPLQLASLKGNTPIVRKMLSLGVDPKMLTDNESSALVFAGASTNVKTLKCFLQTPLFQDAKQKDLATQMVISRDSVSCIRVLHPSPDSLSIPFNGYGTTSAHYAAEHGSVRVLSYLNSVGISINEKDFQEKTPFEKALGANQLSSAKYFLHQTNLVDFTEQCSRGIPFLHYVCQEGFLEMAHLLIKAGAPVNEPDVNERTALHIALWYKNEPLVKLLLQSGAIIDVVAMRDYMPKAHPGIQKLLTEYAQGKSV